MPTKELAALNLNLLFKCQKLKVLLKILCLLKFDILPLFFGKMSDLTDEEIYAGLQKYFGYTKFKNELQEKAVKCAINSN